MTPRPGRSLPGRVAHLALAAALGLPGASEAQELVAYEGDLPRVMVFLEEGASATATTLLSGFLDEAGFEVIDPAFARTAAQRERARKAVEGDDGEATALGRDLGAQLLILGTIPSESQPSPAEQTLRVATAHLSLRALRLDRPRVVARLTADGRGLDATGAGATEKAVREAMEEVLFGGSFLGSVVLDWEDNPWEDGEYWQPGPGSVEAQLQGPPAADPGPAPVPGATGRGLRIAILESDTYPDTASEGTRGITLVGMDPVRARVRGIVSAADAEVVVEESPARLRALEPSEREALGLEGPASEFEADVRIPGEREMVRIRAAAGGASSQVEVSPAVGNRWAVIIGISDYADPGITPLRYADADARSMYDFLRSPEGGAVPEERIRLLLNEEATASAIREALFVFLQDAEPRDFVTVYMASHGSPDPARPSNLYILPYDTDVNAVAATAFPMWDVKTALRRQIAAERVVVIADACRSAGALVDEANPVAGAFSELFSPSRRMTLSAAGLNQVSFEDARWGGGHGVFTHYLLEALSGAGDADGDGVVSFREAADFVRERVSAETDGAQTPEWSGLGDVPLARLDPEQDR